MHKDKECSVCGSGGGGTHKGHQSGHALASCEGVILLLLARHFLLECLFCSHHIPLPVPFINETVTRRLKEKEDRSMGVITYDQTAEEDLWIK